MAKYRPIFTKIWDDPDFKEYSHRQKLVFVYLCTNPLTTGSGIYAISCNTVSDGTCLRLRDIEEMIVNNTIRNVLYDSDSKVVYVRNFLQHNGKGVLLEPLPNYRKWIVAGG